MQALKSFGVTAVATASLVAAFFAVESAHAQALPKGMHAVKPVSRAATSRSAPGLTIRQSQYFSYALPDGWKLGEDGQYAITLLAPDSKALTLMVGNSGMPPNYPAAQYVYERLMALQPQNLQLSQARKATPIVGFAYAYAFDVRYMIRGVPCQGVAILHVAPSYGSAVMAITAALSQSSQWAGYASWLPLVAQQVAATSGAAFGMRGVMAQNLKNSTAYAEAARQYRDWSQRNWQGVTDERNASGDRRSTQFRENLGGVQTYVNPYDGRLPVELPTTYQYYWVSPSGTYVGSNDPSINPNVGSTVEWKRMPRRQP